MNFLLLNNNSIGSINEFRQFCTEFCCDDSLPKYILGRNVYSECIVKHVNIDGFIDDFTNDNEYLNRPVVSLSQVPKNALVLNVAGGRPLSAKQRLDAAGLRNLDYFCFYKLSGLPLTEMCFNEGFEVEFRENKEKYDWIYSLLKDEHSREIFKKLVKFRLEYDIRHLEGFAWKEDVQYFEDFLNLKEDGETFIDVGGYNGYTSLGFIKIAKNYKSIHVFEPEFGNYQHCLNTLNGYKNIYIHNFGLSKEKAKLKLDVQGSGSRISANGAVIIAVDKLDDVLFDSPTFIKMDIEGAEIQAIEGSRNIIFKHNPRLAISVYHKPGDFWKIPELILSIRDDYDIYIRHYTECIYETVMFFIPKP